MAFRSFEDLDIWKRSCRLAVQVYEDLQGCRNFGLTDPMTRRRCPLLPTLLKVSNATHNRISSAF